MIWVGKKCDGRSESNKMVEESSQAIKPPRVIIACHVMEPEMEALRPSDKSVELRYLEQSLHRTPEKMPQLIQDEIETAKEYAAQIVLGYGLCSNGIVGLKVPKQGLIVPKAHDCIAFFLGSHAAYDKAFRERPGTYYLTPGWIAEKKDPLGALEDTYVPRVGRELAVWALKESLKNYTHIALIDTKISDLEPLRERALENARFLDMEYKEIAGRLDYLKKIILGPYDNEDFLFFQPGEVVSQKAILSSFM